MDCGNPPTLENGKILDQTGTTFGSMVAYECDEDYLFADEDVKSRTCEATGSWSDEDIRCGERVRECVCVCVCVCTCTSISVCVSYSMSHSLVLICHSHGSVLCHAQ